MKIKHVVAVVAQICVETDSIHDFFLTALMSRERKATKNLGNVATQLHLTLLCWLLQGKQAFYPKSFPLTLYAMHGRLEVAWFVDAQQSETLNGCTKHTVANCHLFFSCAFGPMSMSF